MRCPESLVSRSSGISKHMDWHCGVQLTEQAQAWRRGSFHLQLGTLLKSGQPRLLSGQFNAGKTGTGILHQFLWTCFLPVQCYKCGHDQGQLRKSENLRVSLQKPCLLTQQDDWVSRGAPQQANICIEFTDSGNSAHTLISDPPVGTCTHTRWIQVMKNIFKKKPCWDRGWGHVCLGKN